MPPRTAIAVTAGNLTARLSRTAHLGRGGIIGGRVTLALQPTALRDLRRGRVTILVTGTNGKTTTTRMLANVVAHLGTVACNDTGANMPDGLVAALAIRPKAGFAVLEVDEGYLPVVLADIAPDMVVLLNLSRDQLDRVGEVRHTERAMRTALATTSATVVANCDDALVTSATLGARTPVWVAAGTGWRGDSTSCPRCGSAMSSPAIPPAMSPVVSPVVSKAPIGWYCQCGLARPQPHWTVSGRGLVRAGGQSVDLAPGLPGPANVANAAFAVVAAAVLGVPPRVAAARVASVTEVDGRYRIVAYRGRTVRTLLAKNPAGWRETLHILHACAGPIVLVVHAHEADGQDLSWLWDIPFERLRGRRVVVSGERATDLAVRLSYAEVAHEIVPDPFDAIVHMPAGPVDVVANYTAFRDLTRRLRHVRQVR
ncbi:MAG: DUF1727 domain-containing protein [Sciscionella sp.]